MSKVKKKQTVNDSVIKAILVLHRFLVQICYSCYMFYCCEEHVLTLMEEHMLWVLRRMYGPWREEVTGDCIMKIFIMLCIPHQNLLMQSNEE